MWPWKSRSQKILTFKIHLLKDDIAKNLWTHFNTMKKMRKKIIEGETNRKQNIFKKQIENYIYQKLLSIKIKYFN